MSPINRPTRSAAVILAALSLAGAGACSISVGGGSSDQSTAAAASQETSSPEQQATASQAATTTSGSATSKTEVSAPSTQGPASPAASAGSAGSVPTAQSASGDRPGAQATITDSKWLEGINSVDKTVAASPTMLIDKANEEIRIEGDVESLSISGTNARVFVDYVNVLTVFGDNVEVYVRDVNRVVIRGSNATVVWAGNTPQIEDLGTNTETRRQGELIESD